MQISGDIEAMVSEKMSTNVKHRERNAKEGVEFEFDPLQAESLLNTRKPISWEYFRGKVSYYAFSCKWFVYFY